jgi:hypothetical protein
VTKEARIGAEPIVLRLGMAQCPNVGIRDLPRSEDVLGRGFHSSQVNKYAFISSRFSFARIGVQVNAHSVAFRLIGRPDHHPTKPLLTVSARVCESAGERRTFWRAEWCIRHDFLRIRPIS